MPEPLLAWINRLLDDPKGFEAHLKGRSVLVYEPRDTPLLADARARGCATIDGVEMLVAQAVGQFEAWSGVEAPAEAMTAAALDAIEAARVPHVAEALS